MDDRPLLARAAPFAGASAVLTVAVQMENAWPRLGMAAATPFLQWQSVVVAIGLGFVCALLAARGRVGVATAVGLFVVVQTLVAFDQTAMKLFGAHMAIGQLDGGWRELAVDVPVLAGDGVRAGGVLLWINLTSIGLASFLLVRGVQRPSSRVPGGAWLALGAYGLSAAVVSGRVDAPELSGYPLGGLLRRNDVLMPALKNSGRVPVASLDSLRDSTWRDDDGPLAAATAATIRAVYPSKPNVVLVVMESVGAEQLLPGGQLSATLTPRLASMAEHATVFPRIYGSYPATTRAHVAIMTGGRTITWGAVDEELTHRSTAPTFVSAARGAGYHTGLFAAPDLRFGSLADFYRTMPWDTVVYYLDGKKTLKKSDEIHSWGVNEDAVRPLAVAWADSVARDGKPFFLEFHTIATHHPYGTWANDRGPATGNDDRARYENSIHYTDAALGRLFDDLARRGWLENTIVAITGDHGEAFAEFHANNTLHRNAIWEENIRNFLILLTPRAKTGVKIQRIGSHGDVLPTVAALTNTNADGVPGQDLLSVQYRPRIQYFYKDIAPSQTGLRDGRWKYVERRDGNGPQLFDLTRDSTEQRNVAGENLARVSMYHALAAAWYLQENDAYTSSLVGWDSTRVRRVTRATLGSMTPPDIAVGRYNGEAGEKFVATPVVGPNDPIYIQNRWGQLPEDVVVKVVVIAPTRRVYEEEMKIASDWDTSWYHVPINRAKAPGEWRVSIWQGTRRLAATTFRVTDQGPR